MAQYLLIESRDPLSDADAARFQELAARLARAGNEVTFFLVQNGVFPARRGARREQLARLAGHGIQVLADDFSLRERGIAEDRLAPGVEAAPLSVVIDLMESGSRALWH